MADTVNNSVYQDTTVPNPNTGGCLKALPLPRFCLKVAQLVLSFVAFVCEEIVEHCSTCSGLYFFEFVSCSAFLLSILALIIYCTQLHEKVGLETVKKLDFWFSLAVGLIFVLASVVFAATNDQTALEKTSIAFGFFASFAFLADLFFTRKAGLKSLKQAKKKPDNIEKTPGPEKQPLNTQ